MDGIWQTRPQSSTWNWIVQTALHWFYTSKDFRLVSSRGGFCGYTAKNHLTTSSLPAHLLPTRQAGSAEVEQPHLSSICCWHLFSSWVKTRFIDVWAWLCSLCTALLRTWSSQCSHTTSGSSLLPLKLGWGCPIKSSVSQKHKRKAKPGKPRTIP